MRGEHATAEGGRWTAYAAAGALMSVAGAGGYAAATGAGALWASVLTAAVAGLAALTVIALVRPWGEWVPWRWLAGATWGAAAFALVHAAPAVADDLLDAGGLLHLDLSAPAARFAHLVYAPLCLLAAALCSLAALAATAAHHSSGAAAACGTPPPPRRTESSAATAASAARTSTVARKPSAAGPGSVPAPATRV